MSRYPYVVLTGTITNGLGPAVYGRVVSRHRSARAAHAAVDKTNRAVRKYNGQSSRSDHGVFRCPDEPAVGSGVWADPISEAEWCEEFA